MNNAYGKIRRFAPWTLVWVLAGCAAPQPVVDADLATSNLTPAAVSADPAAARGTVVWGGVIVSAANLADRTQLEVLGYPLDKQHRPRTDLEPVGRFLVQSADYLETLDYAPGRSVTVLGSLQGLTAGEVGKADYAFPTVTLTNLHLWPQRSGRGGGGLLPPRLSIGIGIDL